jgi:formate dehydrogenase major subunit
MQCDHRNRHARFPEGDCFCFVAKTCVCRHLCYDPQLSALAVILESGNSEGRGAMFRFPLTKQPQTSREPFSVETLAKTSRLRGAHVTQGVCPYCAVGCGQLIFSKGGELIDIEGDPDSPISTGHLCPKGANAYQLSVNSHRVRNVMYRAPYSDQWETKTMEWALEQIAQRVKATRDADFTTRDEQGRLLNSVRSIGSLGGATIDNEENYLIKKLLGGGLGVVSIENQARI